MKTKLTLFILCFCSLLFTGCFEKQSFYGTYSDKSELNPEPRVLVLTEPNFFSTYVVKSYGPGKELKRHFKKGKFKEYDDYLFLQTDTVNNRGYNVYFTNKSFKTVNFGTSEWRKILHRVE